MNCMSSRFTQTLPPSKQLRESVRGPHLGPERPGPQQRQIADFSVADQLRVLWDYGEGNGYSTAQEYLD